jgi:dolichyl-phosphate-mannose--protein O-mannosyl transferase
MNGNPTPRRAWLAPLLLLLAGLATHAAWFTRPLTVVFDEVYFGRYAMAYLKGHDYFDLHPPLAKLLLGATAWVLGLDPGFSWATNGLAFPDPAYALLRAPVHVVGILLPLAFWGVARELGLSRWAAFVVGALAVLDNAWLVMTRVALTDGFFILFGFAALWAYLRHRRSGRARGLWVAAVLAGAALSVKWTALSFLGLMLGLEAIRLWRERRTVGAAGLWRPAALLALPLAVYVASFALHFAVVTPPPDADATMVNAAKLPFGERFVDLNRRMWQASSGMTVKHGYASRWFDWPFMMRTIDFWAQYRDDLLSRIYLLGNPVVWWGTGYCMLFLLVNFVPKLPDLLTRRVPAPAAPAEIFLVCAYLANMLPFTVIGRVMFLYHYLPALGFALLALGLLLDRSGRHAKWLGLTLLALAGAAFVYFAPLTYGLEITRAQFDARFWVNSWK